MSNVAGEVAAATTSLPEQIGGPRNWDYRYCWLRDATLTLQSLLGAGYTDEAAAWREWLLRAVAGDPSKLQIMYGISGRRRLPEAELTWLAGYEGSLLVRTGNAAAGQLQLDVWGEVLDGLSLTRNALLSAPDDSWDLQIALMEHLEGAWDQPDNGLWEMRGPRRHFTHSKVMAWVAADRMVKGVRDSGLPGPGDRWAALASTIHAEVMTRGFNTELNTFVQSYDSTDLDASLLLIPRVGFLPADDEWVIGTIDAIQRDLTQDGFVLRYRSTGGDHGLPGGEGVFLACSFWLVDALQGAGRRDEAVVLFERLLGCATMRHRWRRRVTGGLVALVVVPILGIATLWPLTPSVDSAGRLVGAHLASNHAVELAALPQPDRVGQALIATEDSRFFQTPGIDPISAVRAGFAALTGSNDAGGATLEQQLAKNLYFPQNNGVWAKVQEAELALKLDAGYSKNDVLRLYLADVYFGHGYYGLPAAAHGYFGVAPARLNWAQASMLAGLVQAPSAYDPIRHLSRGRLRQRHVLNRLVATNVLSAAQADAAFAAPLRLR